MLLPRPRNCQHNPMLLLPILEEHLENLFGTLHGQSNHAVEFFTQTKVVLECQPKE